MLNLSDFPIIPINPVTGSDDDPIDDVVVSVSIVINDSGSVLTDDEIEFFELFSIAVPFNQAFEPNNS